MNVINNRSVFSIKNLATDLHRFAPIYAVLIVVSSPHSFHNIYQKKSAQIGFIRVHPRSIFFTNSLNPGVRE
ncbi:hypothetical protein B6D60_07140 [candidate division KSB1 bacterium 4484_87]|nr:MAG: hypothetical protein B6D60_07140 [candidate division KSB1 bacterium 4484_87]